MVTSEPQVNPTDRYSRKETAKLLGIGLTTLDTWTKNGVIKFGIRRANGRKFWTGAEIIKAWRLAI